MPMMKWYGSTPPDPYQLAGGGVGVGMVPLGKGLLQKVLQSGRQIGQGEATGSFPSLSSALQMAAEDSSAAGGMFKGAVPAGAKNELDILRERLLEALMFTSRQ